MSFSCPIAPTRTFGMMLNLSGESRHIYLVSDVNITIQYFTVTFDISYRFFIDALYQLEEVTYNSWFA